jgi:hypothetical protein
LFTPKEYPTTHEDNSVGDGHVDQEQPKNDRNSRMKQTAAMIATLLFLITSLAISFCCLVANFLISLIRILVLQLLMLVTPLRFIEISINFLTILRPDVLVIVSYVYYYVSQNLYCAYVVYPIWNIFEAWVLPESWSAILSPVFYAGVFLFNWIGFAAMLYIYTACVGWVFYSGSCVKLSPWHLNLLETNEREPNQLGFNVITGPQLISSIFDNTISGITASKASFATLFSKPCDEECRKLNFMIDLRATYDMPYIIEKIIGKAVAPSADFESKSKTENVPEDIDHRSLRRTILSELKQTHDIPVLYRMIMACINCYFILIQCSNAIVSRISPQFSSLFLVVVSQFDAHVLYNSLPGFGIVISLLVQAAAYAMGQLGSLPISHHISNHFDVFTHTMFRAISELYVLLHHLKLNTITDDHHLRMFRLIMFLKMREMLPVPWFDKLILGQ